MQKGNNCNINIAKNGDDFQNNASLYVANMESNAKMLHKKNKCKDSKFMYSYINFNSFEEALKFSPRLSICQYCFPNQKDD